MNGDTLLPVHPALVEGSHFSIDPARIKEEQPFDKLRANGL
jgi:hypothetical protein